MIYQARTFESAGFFCAIFALAMKQNRDFRSIEYLKYGIRKQLECYRALSTIRIFEVLAPYAPVLVGTFPLGIEVEGSDLDIVCQAHDLLEFRNLMEKEFSRLSDFSVKISGEKDVLTCNFMAEGFPVEVYASARDPLLGNGYRHMRIEYRLLDLLGYTFKEEIIALKKAGIKTEPAFAQLLGLEGDPYRAVLALEDWPDDRLKSLYKVK